MASGSAEVGTEKRFSVENVFTNPVDTEPVVCMISTLSPEDPNVLDFSQFAGMTDNDRFNHSEFNDEEVRLGKIKGLELLEGFEVVEGGAFGSN
eukprot:932658-Amphidinium_carterae.1